MHLRPPGVFIISLKEIRPLSFALFVKIETLPSCTHLEILETDVHVYMVNVRLEVKL